MGLCGEIGEGFEGGWEEEGGFEVDMSEWDGLRD